jgi:general secretion pathway protein J
MKGFTLVELLVALAALALLAVAGLAMTQFATSARDTLSIRAAETGDIVRLTSVLGADLTQAAPRRAREASGRRPQAALGGADVFGDGVFLSFVRRGWENPRADARSSLQYVEYALREGRIERAFRQQVDGAPLGAPLILATGVRSVDVTYLQFDQWIDTYAGSPERPLPQAIRLDLDLDRRGRLRTQFLLPETSR